MISSLEILAVAMATIPTACAVPFLEVLSYFTLRDRSVIPRTNPFYLHNFVRHSEIKLVLELPRIGFSQKLEWYNGIKQVSYESILR